MADHTVTRDENRAAGPADGARSAGWFAIARSAVLDFIADNAMTHAAAVAFYTALSFAPLLMLTVFIFGQLDSIAGTGTQERVIGEIGNLMGPEAAQVVKEVRAQQAEKPNLSLLTLTGIVGILALIYSASGVFAQLQAALNAIWDVEPAPGAGLKGWLRKRGLSAGVVFAILFLLLASLVVTTMLNAIFGGDGGDADKEGGIIWMVLEFALSFAVYIALFGLIFLYLPDVTIPWKAVWLGATVTAGLFVLGKWLIGLYLGRSDPGSAYGAAGSLLVLLIWVYYSGIIVFLGAEFTQSWAKHKGVTVVPEKHARAAPTRKQQPANVQAQRALRP
jgi:membrane protein